MVRELTDEERWIEHGMKLALINHRKTKEQMDDLRAQLTRAERVIEASRDYVKMPHSAARHAILCERLAEYDRPTPPTSPDAHEK